MIITSLAVWATAIAIAMVAFDLTI
jgi:hypothetical protein